jgi:uncharacterized protein (TIGR02246 family)
MAILIAIGGFALGVLSTLFSNAIISWVERRVPIRITRWLNAFAANPALYIRVTRDTPERRIKEVIVRLFSAWEQQNLEHYLSCWTDDAIRVVSVNSYIEESLAEIRAKFLSSCQRYSQIKVESFVLEHVRISTLGDAAIVQARYRLHLTRRRDGLPILEDATEVYALRRKEDAWKVTGNMDHFSVLGDHATTRPS